jgi:hypothetical protein
MAPPKIAERLFNPLNPFPIGQQTYRVQSGAPEPTRYRIPEPPRFFGEGHWYAPGEVVEVAGRLIPGGMVYVGSSLPCSAGGNDPCLIDPSKPVGPSGDFTIRQTQYWPSYSDISASARAAYLELLSLGRRDPTADIGYVFIFFYGLERRVLIDGGTDEKSKGDWSAIESELRELLTVYGENGPLSGGRSLIGSSKQRPEQARRRRSLIE